MVKFEKIVVDFQFIEEIETRLLEYSIRVTM